MTTTETQRRLGPDDAGRLVSDEEFETALFIEGYRYELVAGRLYVSPAPNPPHMFIAELLTDELKFYARGHPQHVRWVTARGRVLTRQRGATTNVEPDVLAFREVPSSWLKAHWRETRPLLVVEVISESDPRKDLVRNREVYWLVPSIQEYWVVDPRDDAARPSLLALIRGPDGWIERPTPAGDVYRTELLPGLDVDLAALLARGQ